MNRNDQKKPPSGAAKADRKAETADQSAEAPTRQTSGSGMSPTLQAHIGRHVRAVFDEVAEEPIPDHLLRLLKDLDKGGDK
ncbi:MAG: NepR family anti-sigma factor [Hyphomicrobiales bacterium]